MTPIQILVFSHPKHYYLLASILAHLLLGLALITIIKLAKPSKSTNVGPPQEQQDHRPCPSSVPVPAYLVAETLKSQLPAMPYKSFLDMKGESPFNGCDSFQCIVCMECIEPSDVVRVPSECCHAFHRDCLDGWIGQGHATCPLCRSKLWQSSEISMSSVGGDPWRKERMIYLFGEDCVMGFC